MSEHPNAALYRRVMEGFSEGDTSVVEPAIADEAIIDFFSRFGRS